MDIKLINKLANAQVQKNHDILVPFSKNKIFIMKVSEDKAKENKIIEKRILNLRFEIHRAQEILSNKGFINSAPEWKIAQEKAKLKKYQYELAQLKKD